MLYMTNEFDTYFKTISVQVFNINTAQNSRRVIQLRIIMQTISMQCTNGQWQMHNDFKTKFMW